MKKFKSLFLVAAALMVGFSSCNNDYDAPYVPGEPEPITLRIARLAPRGTASVETPGTDAQGTILLENGYIIVFNQMGVRVHSEVLDVTAAMGPGQQLAELIPSPLTAGVMVIGNIPEDVAFPPGGLNTPLQVRQFAAIMTTQYNYRTPVLLNADILNRSHLHELTIIESPLAPIVRNFVDNRYEANVLIQPSITRLELHALTAVADEYGRIDSYTITGVFLDDYYQQFTFGGWADGMLWRVRQDASRLVLGMYRPEHGAPWSGVANTPVSPAGNDVWTFNAAARGSLVPRMIIRVEDIMWSPRNPADPTQFLGSRAMQGNRYITVTGYTTQWPVQAQPNPVYQIPLRHGLLRGHIYRLGGVDGLEFGPGNLHYVPNPDGEYVTVFVDILEWILIDLDADLAGGANPSP